MNRFVLCIGVGVIGLYSSASATLINFDDGQANGSAIDSYYSGSGVTFVDAAWSNNFGVPGSSGSQGLASFSHGFFVPDTNPIGISFSTIASSVTLRGLDVGTQGFRMRAFDSANNLVDNQVVFGTGSGSGQFYDLTVNGQISRVEVFQDNLGTGSDLVLFDNLSFTSAPVPEPATVASMAIGIGAFLRRRKKR